VTETCKKTIKFVYNLISAFVGVTFVNEIHIDARHGTHKVILCVYGYGETSVSIKVFEGEYLELRRGNELEIGERIHN
jgi:hypothetical protein